MPIPPLNYHEALTILINKMFVFLWLFYKKTYETLYEYVIICIVLVRCRNYCEKRVKKCLNNHRRKSPFVMDAEGCSLVYVQARQVTSRCTFTHTCWGQSAFRHCLQYMYARAFWDILTFHSLMSQLHSVLSWAWHMLRVCFFLAFF